MHIIMIAYLRLKAKVFNWQKQGLILLITAETNNFDKLGDQTVKIHN